MKHKWDIEKLEKHKRYYQYLLRGKNRTKEEKQSLKDKIDNLKEMQEIAKGGYYIAPERARIKYIDYENRLPVNTLEDYNAIHPKVRKIMIEAIQSTRDTADTYDNIELPTINLSDEELVNMSLEFADWLPDKKYKEAFYHYLDPKKRLLQFAETLDKEDTEDENVRLVLDNTWEILNEDIMKEKYECRNYDGSLMLEYKDEKIKTEITEEQYDFLAETIVTSAQNKDTLTEFLETNDEVLTEYFQEEYTNLEISNQSLVKKK